jgi:drug efflux transport system permease protein
MSAARIFEMIRKEFRQIFRDPRLYRVLFVAPIVQLLVFGYAVTTDVRNTATFLVDHDHTRASRDLANAFTASGYFRIVGVSESPRDLVRALDRGDALMAIDIPAGFARDLAAPQGAKVQLLFDGANSNVALVAMGYAERIVFAFGARAAPRPPLLPIDLRDRAWYNPELASQTYNVPAVGGAIIMIVCLLLTALSVVREREIGTLEQLMVSPLRPAELILGKTIPFALVALVDITIVTAVALLWFGVPFRGSVVLLLLASVLYILSTLGLGLIVSTISATQQEAFMSVYPILLPAILLSGFMFPVTSMPVVFQWLTLLNPLRHYLEVVRGVFLKGSGFGALWHQLVALALLGAGTIAFAASRFRKTVG